MYTPRLIAEDAITNHLMQAEELSDYMSRNGGKVLDHVDVEEIEAYVWMRQRLHDQSLQEDEQFREKFRDVYSLNGRRMSKKWRDGLFELMEAKKEEDTIDFAEMYHQVYGRDTKGNLGPTQFSVLTKVANTIDHQYPIYEPALGDLMRFKKPTRTRATTHDRMREYLQFYDHIGEVYDEMVEHKPVQDLLKVFKIKNKDRIDHLPMRKRLDFLVRSAASLEAKGIMV